MDPHINPATGVWDDNYYAQKSKTSNSNTTNFNASDPQSAIQAAIEQQKKAVEPAIQSYQAQVPEITQKYSQARTQLQGEQTSLQDRYKSLIDSIKGQGQQDINNQTVVTSNELGKRGIVGSSSLAGQTIQDAVSPLRQKYAGLEKDAALSQEDALRNITNQLSGLTTNETADQRSITQAIAALQSGAGQQGISQGLNLYSQDMQRQLSQQEQERQAQQQEFENSLKQYQLDQARITDPLQNQLLQNQVNKSQQSSGDNGIASLLALLNNGNVAGAQTPKEPKPTYGMSTNNGPVYYR